MIHVESRHQPGIVGAAADFLGRYREFDQSLARTLVPQGTGPEEFCVGVNVARNFNVMAAKVMTSEEKQPAGEFQCISSGKTYKLRDSARAEWLWILGDDHVWAPDLLLNLLDRDVDIVVPLCARRNQPFAPVLCDRRFRALGWDALAGKSGCIDATDDFNLGNAGMLIRRKVLEAIDPPWFVVGCLVPDLESSDLFFCEKARSAGFRIHLDLDNRIGHVTHCVVWPRKQGDTWSGDVRCI